MHVIEKYNEEHDGFTVVCELVIDEYTSAAEHDYFGTLTVRSSGRDGPSTANRPKPHSVAIDSGGWRGCGYWYTPADDYDRSGHVAQIMARDSIAHDAAERVASNELRRWGRMLAGLDADFCIVHVRATIAGRTLGEDTIGGLLVEHGTAEAELWSVVNDHGMIQNAITEARAFLAVCPSEVPHA